MRNCFGKNSVLVVAFVFLSALANGQKKGSLFIIGGGDRSLELMQELVKTAALGPADYIVVLPMATSIPVESVALVSSELARICNNPIASFNFTKKQANDKQGWIDSVQHARLIYITGGDQNRFMDVVAGSKLYKALHAAYNNGATISGTSAGAAVMSQIMITGEERDTTGKGGFKQIKANNVVTSEGMGFLTSAVIDQHFIRRSRYNRLLSVLADYPGKTVIGIDESTAIIVKGKNIQVAGESQVVVISKPKRHRISREGRVSFQDAKLAVLMPGDDFKLK